MARESPPARRHGAFRPDIQGLRALAVLLVLANHLWGTPWSGFLGVDIFFVLSGYLITGLLLREYQTTGRIDLVGFYRRRLKRLAPAAVVATLATVATSALLFSTARFGQTATDSVWASLAAANWRFLQLGTDYLHQSDAPSPFLHYWSLSVEEQFYLVWPLLLLAAGLGGRRLRPSVQAVVVVLAAALSLVFALHETALHPTAAYFSTFTRGWELAAGGVAALLGPQVHRLSPSLQRVLAWGGFVGLVIALKLATPSGGFPAPGGLLVVACTAAVLLGGAEGRSPIVLRMKPVVYVGSISYSLYLWHYPVIVLVGQLFPQHATKYAVAVLVLSTLLAVASYHLVEAPLRRIPWSPRALLVRPGRRPPLTALAAPIAIVLVALSCFSLRQSPDVRPFPDGTLTTFIPTSKLEQVRMAGVTAALRSTSWPTLTPEPLTARSHRAPQWIHDGCLGGDVNSLADPVRNAERCVFGSPHATHRMVVLGDSMALSYVPGLLAAFPTGWRVEVWTMEQCSAADAATNHSDGSRYRACDQFRHAAFDHVARVHPDMAVVVNSEYASSQLASGNDGAGVMPRWTSAVERTLATLSPVAGRVVLLDPPPVVTDIESCKTPISRPRDCVSGINAHYVWTVTAQRAAVAAAHDANVSYPATLSWYCDSHGRCPAFLGSSLLRVDGGHLTSEASKALGPLLRTAIGEGTHL